MNKIIGEFKEDIFLTLCTNIFHFLWVNLVLNLMCKVLSKHFFNSHPPSFLIVLTAIVVGVVLFLDYRSRFHFMTIDEDFNVKLKGRFKKSFNFNLNEVTKCVINKTGHYGRGHMLLGLSFKEKEAIYIPNFKPINKHLAEFFFIKGIEIHYLDRPKYFQIKDISQIEKL